MVRHVLVRTGGVPHLVVTNPLLWAMGSAGFHDHTPFHPPPPNRMGVPADVVGPVISVLASKVEPLPPSSGVVVTKYDAYTGNAGSTMQSAYASFVTWQV